jgi:antibiotic biosynthesis monooxygenase (ABM) superfamily enzyme
MTKHIAITQMVRSDSVALFERALNEFARRSLEEQGGLDMYCLRPPAGSDSQKYGIIRSFANEADQSAFYRSALYREWLIKIQPMVESPATSRELNGLEAWFRNDPADMPPRWKMSVISWIGVWPLSMVVPAMLRPLLDPNVPAFIFAAASAAGIVSLLTWVVMPLLVKLLTGWLRPPKHF